MKDGDVYNLLWFPDAYSNHNGRLQRAVAEGKYVPENLLPGRMLMNMNPTAREELIKADWQNVADWYIKRII